MPRKQHYVRLVTDRAVLAGRVPESVKSINDPIELASPDVVLPLYRGRQEDGRRGTCSDTQKAETRTLAHSNRIAFEETGLTRSR